MIEVHPGNGITLIRDGRFAWLRSIGPAPLDSLAAVTVDDGRVVLNIFRDGNQGIRAGVGSWFSRVSVRGDLTVQIGSVDEPYPAPAGNSTVELAAGSQVIAVGAAPSGAAVAGNPVLIGASKGGVVSPVLVDGAGALYVSLSGVTPIDGPRAVGTGTYGFPVEIAGVDAGGIVRELSLDTFGRQIIVGAAVSGSPASTPAVRIAGTDAGAITRDMLLDTSGRLLGMGNNPRPSFCQQFVLSGVAAVLACIEAPNITPIRIRRIVIYQCGSQLGAGMRSLELDRTTTAGSGGVVTPNALTATGYSGVCRVGNSGTIGAPLVALGLFVPAALGPFHPIEVYNSEDLHADSIVIQPGVANGVALRDLTGGAGGANASGAIFFDMET